MRSEGDVLVQQLTELMADRIVDADGAMELATIAGLASRLGVSSPLLERSNAWRCGVGEGLLMEGLSAVDLETLVEELELVVRSNAPTREVEEALLDVDELLSAAIWAEQSAGTLGVGEAIAALVAEAPMLFEEMSEEASELVQMDGVSMHADVYAYWYAIAALGPEDEVF